MVFLPLSADLEYLQLTNAIRSDLEFLNRLAKDGGPEKAAPTLSEYLQAIKTEQLRVVEASEPECHERGEDHGKGDGNAV